MELRELGILWRDGPRRVIGQTFEDGPKQIITVFLDAFVIGKLLGSIGVGNHSGNDERGLEKWIVGYLG